MRPRPLAVTVCGDGLGFYVCGRPVWTLAGVIPQLGPNRGCCHYHLLLNGAVLLPLCVRGLGLL